MLIPCEVLSWLDSKELLFKLSVGSSTGAATNNTHNTIQYTVPLAKY